MKTKGILMLLLIFCFFSGFSWKENLEKQMRYGDIQRLQTNDYTAVFLSMLSPESYSEEDFKYYLDLTTISAGYRFNRLDDMGLFMLQHVYTDHMPSTIFLGLDIRQIAEASHFQEKEYEKAVKTFLSIFVTAYPDISYEILLSYPSLEEWINLDADLRQKLLHAYRRILPLFLDSPNISLFFTGGEDWLIANPGNYDQFGICHMDVAEHVSHLTLIDGKYLTVKENWEEKLDRLELLVQTALNSPEAPNDSFLSIVFLGDSIMGNYSGSLSVPGAVAGLSSAVTYNCGYSGMAAAVRPMYKDLTFPKVLDSLISADSSSLPRESHIYGDMATFQKDWSGRTDYKHLCFFINFGINDYFDGVPLRSNDSQDIYTYTGALNNAISRLESRFPGAKIVIMSPTFTTYFSAGTEHFNAEEDQLIDYVFAARDVALKTGHDYMDNYHGLGITSLNAARYLDDGVHPNERGRFLMASHIVKKLDALYPKQHLPIRTTVPKGTSVKVHSK
jgi:lysophospholipase L1-like esterase